MAVDTSGEMITIPKVVVETVEASRHAARLVDTPPTEMNPAAMANEVQELLADIPNVEINVLTGQELVDEGLMGIHSVGRCALEEPRMLVASYTPENAKGKHLALVGKGVTFDTGGLNLKISGFMSNMKCDMGGAAAVSGAFRVLTKTETSRKISLIVCLAENAIGPNAFKPDDILTMHSGKTVEINNTDAEGRLLLGDGVSYAARVLKADIVIDAATLTGAQMIATGVHLAAVVSNDDALEASLVDSGRATGDLAHPLPFSPELFKSEFSSLVADMKNSVKNRANAQSSCAGQFVYNHLAGTKAVWGHVDLAGPAFRGDRGTGFGVALLSDVASRLD
jgi:probable aminopeptidase NPEPL1